MSRVGIETVVACFEVLYGPFWSLVQRGSTECGVSNECDREAPQGEAMTRNRVEAPRGEGEYRHLY